MKNEELDTIIEKSLKSRQEFHLPPDFAQKVTLAVVKREQWKVNLKEYLILTGIIISLLAVAVGLNFYMDKSAIGRMLTFVSRYSLPVFCMVFILNFILLADRVLLPLLFNKWSKT
jgi:putative Mn2+ efflux pump MntP